LPLGSKIFQAYPKKWGDQKGGPPAPSLKKPKEKAVEKSIEGEDKDGPYPPPYGGPAYPIEAEGVGEEAPKIAQPTRGGKINSNQGHPKGNKRYKGQGTQREWGK